MNYLFLCLVVVVAGLCCFAQVANGQTCLYNTDCEQIFEVTQCPFAINLGCSLTYVLFTLPCQREASCINSFNPWSVCTVTCGGGTRMRTGTCTGPQCSKQISETEACNTEPCPTPPPVPDVDGNWGNWGSWATTGPCSQSCCTGTQPRQRTRACDNPPPSGNGATCPGSSTETDSVTCNSQICPVSCIGVPEGTFFDSPCGSCTDNFLRCEVGRDQATPFTCGAGTVWSQSLLTCVFPNECVP